MVYWFAYFRVLVSGIIVVLLYPTDRSCAVPTQRRALFHGFRIDANMFTLEYQDVMRWHVPRRVRVCGGRALAMVEDLPESICFVPVLPGQDKIHRLSRNRAAAGDAMMLFKSRRGICLKMMALPCQMKLRSK